MITTIKNFVNTYITSYESIATLLIILVMILKLTINRKITDIHFKKTVISIPSEITFLLIGFLISALVGLKDKTKLNTLVAYFIILLIVLVIQYALERWLDDKLSGTLKWNILLCICIMYCVSILFYVMIVFGGLY